MLSLLKIHNDKIYVTNARFPHHFNVIHQDYEDEKKKPWKSLSKVTS